MRFDPFMELCPAVWSLLTTTASSGERPYFGKTSQQTSGRARPVQTTSIFSIFIFLLLFAPFANAQSPSITLSCSPSHIQAGSTTTCTATVNFTGSVVDFAVDGDWIGYVNF